MGRRTRLQPPTSDRTMLVRDRLLDRLRARWTIPLVVISSPAGYGKTTVLAQAVATNALAPAGLDCWLTCTADDAGAPSLAAALREALDATPQTGGRERVGQLAAGVTEAVWRRSPTQVALVIDDVHEITPGTGGADLLAGIVADLPANGHLVLAGRHPPPLPLARLELEGRLARLDESDLAFTPDEQAAFAAERGVSPERVGACGGWPALAELSVSSTTPGITADYVGQEVLDDLPPARRRTLALLAHVGEMDDEVATAVAGPEADLDAVLAGIPLVSRAATGQRSLHSMWRSLLRDEVSPTEVARARRRAAAVIRRRGHADEAAHLLIEAGAWDDLGDTIVEVLGAAHPPVPRDLLARWQRRLPPAAADRPSGRLLAGVAAAEADPARAVADLEAAAAGFRAGENHEGELASLVQQTQLAWWFEDLDRLTAVAARVFALEAAGCVEAVPLACLGRAVVLDVQNDARSVLSQLDRIPPGSLNDVWQGVVSWVRSTSLMHLGDAPGAQAAADEALAHAGPLHRPLADAARLLALWFQGEVETVAAALPGLVERTGRSGLRNYTAIVTSQCSLVDALSGRQRSAEAHLARARATAGASRAPLVDTNLSIAAAAVDVARGDDAAAAAALEDHLSRQPLGRGNSAAPQQRSLALFYVLVPDTRPFWDGADLGPAFVVARDLARSLVAVRDGLGLPDGGAHLPDPALACAHLPRRWMVELALAAVAERSERGWVMLDALWPDALPDVEATAAHGVGRLRTAARTALKRLPVPPTDHLDLQLLGPVELVRRGSPVGGPDWRRGRVRSLLAYLALHDTASRSQVADDLWPALDAEAQSRNLRVTLTYLLRVLEPDRPARGASFFVRQDGNHLTLHPGDRLAIDVWSFDALADQAEEADQRGSPSVALGRALAAVELWRGDPTELVGENWAIPHVERRRLRFAALATRAGELLLAKGAVDAARNLAERALAVDAWLEDAHRLVVAAHRAAGDDLAARRALARFREAMDDLGVGPDDATLMVERLLDSGAGGARLAAR